VVTSSVEIGRHLWRVPGRIDRLILRSLLSDSDSRSATGSDRVAYLLVHSLRWRHSTRRLCPALDVV